MSPQGVRKREPRSETEQRLVCDKLSASSKGRGGANVDTARSSLGDMSHPVINVGDERVVMGFQGAADPRKILLKFFIQNFLFE